MQYPANIALPPAEIVSSSYLGGGTQISPNSTTHNHTGMSFGTADADRYIVAVVTTWENGDGIPSSMTIGGVSASRVYQSNTGSNLSAIVGYAKVPSGTTGTVTVNLTQTSVYSTCWTYRLVPTEGCSIVLHDSDKGTAGGTGTTLSLYVNVPEDGTVIAASTHSAVTPTYTAGVTRNDYYSAYRSQECGSSHGLAEQTNRLVRAGGGPLAGVALSFGAQR